MRIALALAATLSVAVLSPALAASADHPATVTHHHHHHHHYHQHHVAASAPHAVGRPAAEAPVAAAPQNQWFKPYPPGQGDTDGLSRDEEDCEKGCIGGNPE